MSKSIREFQVSTQNKAKKKKKQKHKLSVSNIDGHLMSPILKCTRYC